MVRVAGVLNHNRMIAKSMDRVNRYSWPKQSFDGTDEG